MNTGKLLFIGLMASIGLTSCTEDVTSPDTPVYASGIRIEVTDGSEAGGKANTRVAYSGFSASFQEGDAIGLYAVNGTTTVSTNVKFTKQSDGSWLPEDGKTVTYNPDYTYYAYYPYTSSPYSMATSGNVDARFAAFITDSSNKFHKADQSTLANFMASDYMHAQGVVTGDKIVKFTMNHKKAMAVISDANIQNKWYYSDDTGTQYTPTLVFSGNVPYENGAYKYFLMKPNTSTSVGGLQLSAESGKYIQARAELTGTPTYEYATSTDQGATFGTFTTSRPAWLTVATNTPAGGAMNLSVTATATKTTSISLGTGSSRVVAEDATLKSATPVSNVDLSMVGNDGSARGSRTTANCYLVHAPGTYRIPLVYGNAIKNGNESATTSFYTTQTSNTLQRLVDHTNTGITGPWITSKYTVNGAKLIWEDVKGMISSVGVSGQFLTFTVDPDKIAAGNAVIAATSNGTVVWSWHVWVTTETLNDLTTVATGSHTYRVAPVNVGQTNGTFKVGTVYAGSQCKVRATANSMTLEFIVTQPDYLQASSTYYDSTPYFQWGRKDAMMPNVGAYDATGTHTSTYTSGTTLITATSATIGATIQNPQNWYYNSSNTGPYGTGTNAAKYNYWDMNNTTASNNIITATVKTVYDPCPPGFCVPTSNLYYYINQNYSAYFPWTATNASTGTQAKRTWTKDTPNLIFLASGYRYNSTGSVGNVGSYGYCWSASPYSGGYGYYLYFNSSSASVSNSNRAYGCSVRAVAEE